MRDAFDAFWAVDWSGARAGYRGVAAARAQAETSAVAAVSPPRGAASWTRTALVERLVHEIASGRRLLIGFDFAFSFARGSRSALGLAQCETPQKIWAEVDRRCMGAADCYGGAFVERAPAGIYWRRGARPAGWDEGLRVVDVHARTVSGVRPESMLKLVGTKQVGLASLAGMRALHALRLATGDRLALWPGPVARGQSVVVEIFPTLFRRAALGGLAKIRDGATLQRALATWKATAPRALRHSPVLSDDLTDALVSAAALRHIARSPRAFDPPKDPAAAGEGWIFGVST